MSQVSYHRYDAKPPLAERIRVKRKEIREKREDKRVRWELKPERFGKNAFEWAGRGR
jgi:hypothetical protein